MTNSVLYSPPRMAKRNRPPSDYQTTFKMGKPAKKKLRMIAHITGETEAAIIDRLVMAEYALHPDDAKRLADTWYQTRYGEL